MSLDAPYMEPSDIDRLFVDLRKELATLMGTGEPWQITLNGTTGNIKIDVRHTKTLPLRRVRAPLVRRVAE